jgi:hypothetical protein
LVFDTEPKTVGRPGTHYIAQAGFEFSILLPQIPECWDYRCAPPHLALLLSERPGVKVLGLEVLRGRQVLSAGKEETAKVAITPAHDISFSLTLTL